MKFKPAALSEDELSHAAGTLVTQRARLAELTRRDAPRAIEVENHSAILVSAGGYRLTGEDPSIFAAFAFDRGQVLPDAFAGIAGPAAPQTTVVSAVERGTARFSRTVRRGIEALKSLPTSAPSQSVFYLGLITGAPDSLEKGIGSLMELNTFIRSEHDFGDLAMTYRGTAGQISAVKKVMNQRREALAAAMRVKDENLAEAIEWEIGFLAGLLSDATVIGGGAFPQPVSGGTLGVIGDAETLRGDPEFRAAVSSGFVAVTPVAKAQAGKTLIASREFVLNVVTQRTQVAKAAGREVSEGLFEPASKVMRVLRSAYGDKLTVKDAAKLVILPDLEPKTFNFLKSIQLRPVSIELVTRAARLAAAYLTSA